jgi:hypothetical protein
MYNPEKRRPTTFAPKVCLLFIFKLLFMNKLPVYYPGSSVSVSIRLRDGAGGRTIPPADYCAEAAFYTRLLGRRIRVPEVEIAEGDTLRVTLPPGETEKLAPGSCTMRLVLTHRRDGSRLIVVRKIFQLQESLNYE